MNKTILTVLVIIAVAVLVALNMGKKSETPTAEMPATAPAATEAPADGVQSMGEKVAAEAEKAASAVATEADKAAEAVGEAADKAAEAVKDAAPAAAPAGSPEPSHAIEEKK